MPKLVWVGARYPEQVRASRYKFGKVNDSDEPPEELIHGKGDDLPVVYHRSVN